jgi:hypothetical protein
MEPKDGTKTTKTENGTMATLNQIESTTFAQIGGVRAMVMIGGTVQIGHGKPNQFWFKFKARGLNGINSVKITLDADDTYTMVFSRMTIKGENVKVDLSGVYADQLVGIIERKTGLYLSL